MDVEASDGEDDDTITVTINVINLDEPGQVSFLSASAPEVGKAFIATLYDPDGRIDTTSWRWQWERSADGAAWSDISSATQSFYTPESGDADQQLRATVTYRDAHGPGKRATSAASSPVIVPFPTFGNPPTVSVGADRTSIVASYTLPTDPNFDYQVAALRSETGSFEQGSYVLADSTFSHPSSWTYSPTQSGWYKIALRACTDGTASHCGQFQQSADTPFKLPPPRNIDVTPLPLRKASLTWDVNPSSSSYVVQVRKTGTSAWDFPTAGQEPSGTRSMPEYEIALDVVTTSSGGTTAGFADADGFQFRARANASTGLTLSSEYSHFITIIDSPIIEANGNSPGSQGQAKLSWRTITSVLGDASYLGGTYSFRYRKAGGDHTQLAWRPGTYVSDETVDQAQMTGTNRDTIGGLTKETVYAIQFRYEKTGKSKVYAARDAYVWPSNDFPPNASRVGTFSFFGHWKDGKYEYTVCEDTFSPATARSEWTELIVHAFEQWEAAAPDLLTVTQTFKDCTDGVNPISNDNPITLVLALFNHSNEVYMVDVPSWYREPDILHFNPLFLCIKYADACVISPRYWDTSKGAGTELESGSVDVLVKAILSPAPTDSRTLHIPGNDRLFSNDDVSFNTCQTTSGETFGNYRIMVHEAGHALGLSDFSSLRFLSSSVAHPSIPDTVMNYDWVVRERLNFPDDWNEPDCSPHPIDIMAIRALYQPLSP